MIIDKLRIGFLQITARRFPPKLTNFHQNGFENEKNPASIYFFKGKRRKKTFTEHSVGKKSTSASNGVFFVSPRINMYFTPSESVGEKVNRLITV